MDYGQYGVRFVKNKINVLLWVWSYKQQIDKKKLYF
jgi:hypothetical protein